MAWFDPERHHRRSIRLQGYDYTQPGKYFITICTQGHVCLFGDVVNGEMRLNGCGRIARDEWLKTADLRQRVQLDAFIVMPNHIHGIIVLTDDGRRETLFRTPTTEQFGKPTSDSIPTIVRLFKSSVTTRINKLLGTPGTSVWQRNYYEHIVRDDGSLNRIRQYIENNPARWSTDRNNPFR